MLIGFTCPLTAGCEKTHNCSISCFLIALYSLYVALEISPLFLTVFHFCFFHELKTQSQNPFFTKRGIFPHFLDFAL